MQSSLLVLFCAIRRARPVTDLEFLTPTLQTLFQFLDSAMFTFEERFNEGIAGTDAKGNGETAADVMKVVKEEVLLVSCPTGALFFV